MREIKFRAWDKEDEEMKRVFALDLAEWWVATNYYGGDKGVCDGERNSFKNEETDRHILMQYTGLKDKNGKEIYEGDIVFVKDLREGLLFRGFVSFGDASFYIQEEEPVSHYRWMDYEIEVIGNIYENKEVLDATTDSN